MCGIVGYVSLQDKTRVYSKEKFLTEGLYVNALRGFDSTGVMGVSDDMTWEYSKQAVPAARFINADDWAKRNFEQWATVGHNRAATVGAIDTDNSHPFHHGNILLVHNGTLRSTYDLPFKNADIDVDSSLIAYNLNEVEPGEAVDKVIKNLQGAYALVWFDLRDESINFVRNTERPLHFGLNKSADILYFMSEGHMLNMITKRFADHSSRPTNIWQLGVRQMLKYKKGSLMPEVSEVPNFTNGRAGWDGYYQRTPNSNRPTPPIVNGRRHGESAECHHGGSKGIKIRINGEYKIPPKPLRDMVTEWYSLKLTQQLYFRPGGFLPWNEGGRETGDVDPVRESAMGAMYGLIYHPEWDCWIEAKIPYIRESQARVCKQSNGWTVVPYAIDHTTVDESSKHGFTIVCRAKWFSWDGQPPFPTDSSDSVKKLTSGEEKQAPESDSKLKLHDWEQNFDADDIEEAEEMLKGPRGNYIRVNEWEAITNDGCVMCTGPVYLEDAEEMIWVGEHENQPLCMGCFDWASSPEGGYK
jgi:hypothetical protein